MTAPPKRSVFVFMDNTAYSGKLLLTLIDLADMAALTGYADMKIVMPRSILFETSGRQALRPEEIPDLHDKQISSIMQIALKKGTLVIPEEMDVEKEPFDEIRRRVDAAFPDKTQFTNKILSSGNKGKYSKFIHGIKLSDLGDKAFDEWHNRHLAELGHSDVVLLTEDRELIKPIRARDETRHNGLHFDQFRNATSIDWMREEYEEIKKQVIGADAGMQHQLEPIDRRLQQRILSMSGRKENINTTDIDAGYEQRLRDKLDGQEPGSSIT